MSRSSLDPSLRERRTPARRKPQITRLVPRILLRFPRFFPRTSSESSCSSLRPLRLFLCALCVRSFLFPLPQAVGCEPSAPSRRPSAAAYKLISGASPSTLDYSVCGAAGVVPVSWIGVPSHLRLSMASMSGSGYILGGKASLYNRRVRVLAAPLH